MKKISHMNYRTHEGRFALIERWKCNYIVGAGFENLAIQKDYATNGASIPRVFWWILSPFDPRYIEETTIHDNLCDRKQYKRADAWFEQLLIDNDEIAAWHRKVFISSVKGWHWVAYQDAGYFEQAEPRAWLRIVKKMLTKKGV